MKSEERIKSFVQETLGCGCPEEVFDIIECEQDVKLEDGMVLLNRINIGNRLLIYIKECDSDSSLEGELSRLLDLGKKERDYRGFNRFRLVIITDKNEDLKNRAQELFDHHSNKDEKVHLHVLEKEEYMEQMGV